MLDGLLGRGFAAKCKPLIKATKTRIELVRKKRMARERFLKKDIADLLASGLDSNAYGRIEGLMGELTLSSCYNFVDQCCDLLYKQLSVMQKQSECPAECQVPVASLMFAAARFSDLPELRDLRDAFQEKYGNSLQYHVNQKFVEDLSSPPPTMEKKMQLMQDIAAEYSISWNRRNFEKQMAKPSVRTQQEQRSRNGSAPVKDKIKANGDNLVDEKDKNHILSKVDYKVSSDRNRSRARNGDGKVEETNMQSGKQNIYSNGHTPHKVSDDKAKRRADDGPTPLKVKESHLHRNQLQNSAHSTTDSADIGTSSYGRVQDNIHREIREVSVPKRVIQQTFPQGSHATHTHADDVSSNVPNGGKLQDAHTDKAKSFSKMTPPPYVKPPKVPKAENKSDLKYSGLDGNITGKSSWDDASQRQSSHSITDETLYASHRNKHEKESTRSSKGIRDGLDDVQINQDEPEKKSVRRRHSSRSSSNDDDVTGNLESANTEQRSSSSRRSSETKRVMRILSGDEPRMKDEEKVLDKLLIHLSRKPTTIDPHKMPTEASGIRHNVVNNVKHGNVAPLSPHSRSVSLPSEQSIPSVVPAKVFTRAASFQPDRPAKHVHPNLPDCDDLAARIAALRSSN